MINHNNLDDYQLMFVKRCIQIHLAYFKQYVYDQIERRKLANSIFNKLFFLQSIEMALKDRSGTFIVGNRVTQADLLVLTLIDTIEKFLPKFKHGCMVELDEIKENVLKQKPNVARYLRSRPVTDF